MKKKFELRIGKFLLMKYDDESIWIGTSDGEGGQFSEKELEKIIEKFYMENL